MADPAAVEGGNFTSITPFSAALRKELVLVANLVCLLIPKNNDIDYRMLVFPREHFFLYFSCFMYGHRDQIACSLLGGFSKPRTAAIHALDSVLI